ncbi:head-tail joining protein [Marinagarivorans algicola]|uniref:head-tail joining protein n=1 Tax=Marinagarivorans algicola TaxID=1513270 RepID=UPI003734D63B
MLPSFDEQVSGVNRGLIAAFSIPVIFHYPDRDAIIEGIYNHPSANGSPTGGGHIADYSASLEVLSHHAVGVAKGFRLTIQGRAYSVIKPPEHEGSGLCKIYVSRVNESESEPDIRY